MLRRVGFWREYPLDIATYCATRLQYLRLEHINDEILESFCEFLKKWKITRDEVGFNEATVYYPRLLKDLQPTKLYVSNFDNNFTVNVFNLPANSNFHTVVSLPHFPSNSFISERCKC